MLPSRTFSGKLAEPMVIDWPAPPPPPPPPPVPPVDSPVAAVVAVAPAAVSLLDLLESEPQAARSINDALAAASVSLSCLLMGEPPGKCWWETLPHAAPMYPNSANLNGRSSHCSDVACAGDRGA